MSQEEIRPEEFVFLYGNKEQLEQVTVLDVREPEEWDYYHLEGSVLMPMRHIPAKLNELPPDRPLYVICAHGVRSEMVCRYLRQQGFANAVNVEGGMAAVAELQGFRYD